MTINEALREARSRLQPVAGTGALDGQRLMEHVSGLAKPALILRGDEALETGAGEQFFALVRRRERGEPIAYLIGSVGFYGRTFAVDSRVLVPRPETEHLIEAVIDDLRGRRKAGGTIVDVGTGSGAIAITLACELPDLNVFATDVSAEALEVARHNAAANNVFQHVTFLHGDLLAPLRAFGPVDAIVANLPYIPAGAVPPAPNPVSFEPRVALDGGPDGLGLYRRFLREIPAVAAPGASVFLEAAPGTIEPLAELAQALLPGAYIEIGEDYGGLERFVNLSLPG
ncbi:MAG: peptide chain release factor N(5)-glutamine methyltransferase [Candidatus Velthaea sp.]|jgi:release factor glutamine methyltransferase